MARITLTSLSTLRVSTHQIPRHNNIPNTSILSKPLLIYHSCLPSSATASSIESHLKDVGVVAPQWRYTMYSTTHFHSTTHEVLCISSGHAKLCQSQFLPNSRYLSELLTLPGFGGEANSGRVETDVQKGDVIVIPAGVGHRLLEDFNSDFEMVGSYPKGKSWDMCYGTPEEGDQVKGISELGWFEKDPLYGDEGPVLKA
jgi:uncharacterized protein YjlB